MKRLMLLVGMVVFSLHGLSAEIKETCGSCNTDLDFELKAQSLTFNKMGSNNVLIGNVNNGKLKYFNVLRQQVDGEGWAETTISQLSVPSYEQAEFDQAMAAKNQLAARMSHEVSRDTANSAWDMVGQPFIVNDMVSDFNRNGDIITYTSLYIGHMMSVFGKASPFNDDLIFTFVDGSWARFQVSDVVNGNLVFKLIDAKDIDNNDIKAGTDSFKSQVYRFTISGNFGLSEFLAAGGRVGITLVSNTSGSGGSGTISCDSSLLCTVTIIED